MTPARRVCLLVALAFAAACGGAERPRPDIWLVVLDTTRADHLGVYGHRRPTTPFLDRLARSAAVFEDAWSASTNTAPATASLFTSQYPRDHGVTLGFYGHQRQVDDLARRGAAEMEINQLPSKTPTLPEVLANAGYRTFGLASNINIGSEIGFSRGFDRFERHPLADADALEQRLMPWQDEIEGGRTPFFLYLHLNDAHQPYTPRAPWRQAWRGPDETKLGSPAAYDSEIRFTDEMLGRVYERIGRLREALVVVASDHGEEFFDHGSTGHGLSLHRELQRMVLLVRPGGGLPEAARIDTPVSIIDVLPTVADFAGISADPVGWVTACVH